MSAIDPDQSPIFVIGTGRSGTTLLRQMLNAHPRIYLTQEASFYVTLQDLPRDADGGAWLERYFGTFSFAWLRLDPAEIRRRLPEHLRRTELPCAFAAIMRAKAQQMSRPRYGDKTPFYASYLGRILDDFPDPRIIHIVRDPRPTVASLRRMPWAPGSFMLNNYYVYRQLEEVVPYRDRIAEVRLEDLLAEPRRQMGRLLEFVGEPWDERVLDHVNHAPRDDVPPVPWLQTATRARGQGRTRWQDALPPAWVRLIERRHRAAMARYGYQPAELAHEPSRRQLVRAWLSDLPEALRCLRRSARMLRRRRRQPPPTAAEAQRWLVSLNPQAWQAYPGFEMPEPPPVPHLDGNL